MIGTELSADALLQIANEPTHAVHRYLFAAAASEVLCSGRLSLIPPRHFLMLTTVEPAPFLTEIANLPADAWNQNGRHKITVQRETRAIALTARAAGPVDHRHEQYIRRCPIADELPRLMHWLEEFAMTTGNGSLQLARIVKLKPGGQVYPHVDRGLYYLVRDRYHLVLQSPSGSRLQCEDQTSVWHEGQVWWFNNHVVHQSFNDGDDERIHVIFDVLPRKNEPLVPVLQRYAMLAA